MPVTFTKGFFFKPGPERNIDREASDAPCVLIFFVFSALRETFIRSFSTPNPQRRRQRPQRNFGKAVLEPLCELIFYLFCFS
jgi:hypothetical protein